MATLRPKSNEAPPAYQDIEKQSGSTDLPPEPDLSSISLDGTLIYPTTPPATSLYELTHEVNSGYSVVGILRLVPSRQPREDGIPVNPRDKLIYEFRQPPMTPDTVEIVGKRRSTLPGTVFLRLKNRVTGRGWEVEHSYGGRKILLYRTKPSWRLEKRERLDWQDAGGNLVAEETWSGDEGARPIMKILKELDEKMMDILVTSWCARLWLGNQKANAQGKESELDAGAFPPNPRKAGRNFISNSSCPYSQKKSRLFKNRSTIVLLGPRQQKDGTGAPFTVGYIRLFLVPRDYHLLRRFRLTEASKGKCSATKETNFAEPVELG